MPSQPDRGRATIAIYDRPPWWRTRKFWRLALPVCAALGSLIIWYLVFA